MTTKKLSKEELLKKFEFCKMANLTLERKTEEKIKEMFNSVLGDDFLVKFKSGYSFYRIEIGLKKDNTNVKFGHDFTISYTDNYKMDKGKFISNYELEMNYGTMGAYNMIDDLDRIKYIVAIGKVAGNKQLIDNLKKTLDEHMEIDLENRMQYREVKEQLEK